MGLHSAGKDKFVLLFVLLASLMIGGSGCDSTGPQSCAKKLSDANVSEGEFAVQVRQGGECDLWRGENAQYNMIERSPIRQVPHFYSKLSVSAEGGPRLYFAQQGESAQEGSYNVADLTNTGHNVITTVGEKAGVGGQRLAGSRVLSESGTFTVEAVGPSTVTASFEVKLVPYDDSNQPIYDSSEAIRVRGRFKAEYEGNQTWVIF